MNALDITSVKQAKLTPMMAQYIAVKEQYQEMLLFYRMGDFYEMFFHDAEVAAQALGIALTHRGKIEDRDIAMCGVPVHAMDGYHARLIQQGYKVAICEQSETPEAFKKRGGKGPLPRDVVRVVTPGTVQEDGLLQARQHNFLVAVGRVSAELAIAWADMSTGDFYVQPCSDADIDTMLARLQSGLAGSTFNVPQTEWVEWGPDKVRLELNDDIVRYRRAQIPLGEDEEPVQLSGFLDRGDNVLSIKAVVPANVVVGAEDAGILPAQLTLTGPADRLDLAVDRDVIAPLIDAIRGGE